jgi:hypothetical protein
MAQEYTNLFSEVLLKIVLSEQLGLFCFLFILNILKEVHSKKIEKSNESSKDDSQTSGTNSSQGNSRFKTKEYSIEHHNIQAKSTTLYKKDKNVTSVKSDNKYNISTIKLNPNLDSQSDKKFEYSLQEKANSFTAPKHTKKVIKKDIISKPPNFKKKLSIYKSKKLEKIVESEKETPIKVKSSIFKVLPSTYLSMYNLMIFHSVAVITVLANTSYNYYVLSVLYVHMIMFILTFIMFQRQSACAAFFEALTFSLNSILILLSLVHTAINYRFYIEFKNFIESYTFYV